MSFIQSHSAVVWYRADARSLCVTSPLTRSEALERHARHGVEGTVALVIAFGDIDVHDAAAHGLVDAHRTEWQEPASTILIKQGHVR
jgi:hypothetical protein